VNSVILRFFYVTKLTEVKLKSEVLQPSPVCYGSNGAVETYHYYWY